ncbi:hypothetical protein H5410_020673 [Solanum commersonii]|uniref:Uncharacterized protein n=1 Tax=Solanum commersonii TaxID=4109 RepID=A0A9J5ZBZ4_SOLCO|nr:hypothetical protein H5410_020673 [Solanum commersonii]
MLKDPFSFYVLKCVVVVDFSMTKFLVLMMLPLSDTETNMVMTIAQSITNFRDIYATLIEPFPLLSSHARRQSRSPPKYDRKKRFNEVKFKMSKVTCSKCATAGHNKKTCMKSSPQN